MPEPKKKRKETLANVSNKKKLNFIMKGLKTYWSLITQDRKTHNQNLK
jgi:hypothetical protein